MLIKKYRKIARIIPFVLFAVIFVFAVRFTMLSEQDVPSKPLLIPKGWQNIKPPEQITSIIEWSRTGEVLAANYEGVYRLDLKTGNVIGILKQDMPMDYARMIMEDRDRNLWVCHLNGVSVFDGTIWKNFSQKDGLPDNRVNCVLQDKKGFVWVGTDGGAARYENGKWTAFTISDGLMVNTVNAMVQANDGSMFFGSNVSPNGGISCLSSGRWKYFTVENGLPHNHIVALTRDLSGDIWAGTGYMRKGGACRFTFESGEWVIKERIFKEDGLAGEKVCCIFEQEKGLFWFGSEYDGITMRKDGRWKVISPSQGLAGTEVKSILHDTSGNLWFATPGGITRILHNAEEELITSK